MMQAKHCMWYTFPWTRLTTCVGGIPRSHEEHFVPYRLGDPETRTVVIIIKMGSWCGGAGPAGVDTYLKKSSLHNSWPFLMKHRSLSGTRHSVQCRHLACHVRSDTLRMNRSRISSWQPPHFGMEAGMMKEGHWKCYSLFCRRHMNLIQFYLLLS